MTRMRPWRVLQASPCRGPGKSPSPAEYQFTRDRIHRIAATAATPPRVRPSGWDGLGRPEPRRPGDSAARHAEDEITDLKVLAEAIHRAAAGLRIPPQPSPWLAPLPDALLLRDLPAPSWPPRSSGPPGAGHAPIPFGLINLPRLQQQQPAAIDLDTFGHLMAAGAPRSGRSQLLRTLAAAVAACLSCADAHLYGIDGGNGALLPLAELPHCGAVVTRTQDERAARLLARLAAELTRRQDLLAAGGCAQIAEQRAAAGAGDRLPHVLVLLDRWEGFVTTLGEAGGGALTDVITRILAEGASAGIHLVMTGDRSLLAGRIAALCEDKLAPPARPRPPRCGRSPTGPPPATLRYHGPGGRSGSTCSRPGSASTRPGGCARRAPARCGHWPASVATS
jgi:DNA segregation ATPase FtsK/SpoIIIE, S-DNA-T family